MFETYWDLRHYSRKIKKSLVFDLHLVLTLNSISRWSSTVVFLGKTYDVSPYDSQRSHPSMDLGVKWDLCVLFVQTAVKCQDCKFV